MPIPHDFLYIYLQDVIFVQVLQIQCADVLAKTSLESVQSSHQADRCSTSLINTHGYTFVVLQVHCMFLSPGTRQGEECKSENSTNSLSMSFNFSSSLVEFNSGQEEISRSSTKRGKVDPGGALVHVTLLVCPRMRP